MHNRIGLFATNFVYYHIAILNSRVRSKFNACRVLQLSYRAKRVFVFWSVGFRFHNIFLTEIRMENEVFFFLERDHYLVRVHLQTFKNKAILSYFQHYLVSDALVDK